MWEWILSKIGITGVIVIVLMGAIGVEAFIINRNRAKIESLNNTIATMKQVLQTQNDSIEESGKKSKQLQSDLDTANDANKKLRYGFVKLKDSISIAPLAMSCSLAVSELKQRSTEQAVRWNK